MAQCTSGWDFLLCQNKQHLLLATPWEEPRHQLRTLDPTIWHLHISSNDQQVLVDLSYLIMSLLYQIQTNQRSLTNDIPTRVVKYTCDHFGTSRIIAIISKLYLRKWSSQLPFQERTQDRIKFSKVCIVRSDLPTIYGWKSGLRSNVMPKTLCKLLQNLDTNL